MINWKKHHLVWLQINVNTWSRPTSIKGRVRDASRTTLGDREVIHAHIEPRSRTTINELYVTQIEGYPPTAMVCESDIDRDSALITQHHIIEPETDSGQSTLPRAANDQGGESTD